MELDQTLTSRDVVNAKMRDIIDEATDPWGIKVNRVELKNILPPPAIQESMEKQMRAERERREAILRAEGEKRSNILVAEGEKEAAILRAEAKKISLLTEAEGTAQAIKKIIESKPDAAYLTLQGFEALKVLGEGEATKIIVPSDLQNVATLFTSMSEMLGHKMPTKTPAKK
jgi:regulator of protease activity HflC (stomatin/prohibitin superfamily)